MKRLLLCALIVACGGSTEPKKTDTLPTKPKAEDPAIQIHVLDRLDTTTAMGKATWQVFALIYSPDPNQTGVATWGGPNQHGDVCGAFSADSIGQRQIIVLGLADTISQTTDATASTVAHQWFNGDHTLPAGWAALASDSVDWGISAQFDAGHGRTSADPIRWSLTWSSSANLARAESPNDATCQ